MSGSVRTWSVALQGLSGTVVEVEAHLANSLPGIVVIGLPDAALNEARERVRSAAANSGCPLPARKLTVNLSPAELPKHGAGFDLAIALAALAAGGAVRAESLAGMVHLGELGLDGRLRPVRGVLPAVLAAARAGFSEVMVPIANREEAALVPGVRVHAVASLHEAARWHGGAYPPEPGAAAPLPAASAAPPLADEPDAAPEGDLAEVVGNAEAVLALRAAAAGGHHLLMLGPPGAGKTMLAARLPGILPDLDSEASIEASCVRSLTGAAPLQRLVTRPPFIAPHHTATAAAMVGGGSGRIVPGAVARASHGVLFLDEAPEFSRVVLDALRQPMERGTVSIHRAGAVAEFPARFQLVLAANPCPCGYGGGPECVCPAVVRRRYLQRLSGPLLDRMDLLLRLRRVSLAELRLADGAEGAVTTTAAARAAVIEARAVAAERFAGCDWRVNAAVPPAALRGRWRLPRAATAALDHALERGLLTLRGYDRVLRVAWSLADLAGVTAPHADQVGQALALRTSIGVGTAA